jgi:hypothetical protein
VPTAFAVRTIAFRCAKPISPLETAWVLSGTRSSFWPTAIRSAAAVFVWWLLKRIQSIAEA